MMDMSSHKAKESLYAEIMNDSSEIDQKLLAALADLHETTEYDLSGLLTPSSDLDSTHSGRNSEESYSSDEDELHLHRDEEDL